MSKTFTKRQIVFSGLVIALVAAVFVNWYFTRPAAEIDAGPSVGTTGAANLGDAQYVNATGNSDYFEAARLKRTQAHDEAKAALQKVAEDSGADAESKKSAQAALEALTNAIKLEAEIENLITARTGGECLVTLGETAEVILAKGTLGDTTAVQIKEIIVNKTEISAEKITLVEVK